MLRPRIIPCLLVRDKGLVKTVGFSDPTYIGDPVNAVRIFNEKAVDELIVLDIDATVESREPDYRMIENIAAESRMPVSYGGGIKTVEQAKTIIGLGVEKVALSSSAIQNPGLIGEIAQKLGSQSVALVLDAKKRKNGIYEVWTHNATFNTKRSPGEVASELEGFGIGELIINSIDNDGRMKGYDLDLVRQVRNAIRVHLTVLGGAGSMEDIRDLVREFGIIGAAAGSMFVFKGSYRAVLINYPGLAEREQLFDCLAEGVHACK